MPEGKGKHLDLEDRIRIEDGLRKKERFSEIARAIGVSPSTVTREVKGNRHFHKGSKTDGSVRHNCLKGGECRIRALCGDGECTERLCSKCKMVLCSTLCHDFEERICPLLKGAPYVCNACAKRGYCSYGRSFYRATYANEAYEHRLVTSREGISVGEAELRSMVTKVRILLRRNQSLEAIWATHKDEFPVGVRTFYRYIEAGVFGLCNMELPKKVKYKARRKRDSTESKVDLTGRTFDDFKQLPEDVRRSAVQMDCVEGAKTDFKVILTLHLPRFEFQIYILLHEHTQECVTGALDWIETLCGGRFAELFPVILTDRGHEFLDYRSLEKSLHGGRRCEVFYCDALKPGQKGSCEKNHVELRKIMPKGSCLEELTAYEVATVCSHVNSYPRPSLGGATPYAFASQVLPGELLEGLGISSVPADEVTMNPSLLKKH